MKKYKNVVGSLGNTNRQFFNKLVFTVFIYVNVYSLIYFLLSARFSSLILLITTYVFTPIVIYLDRNKYSRLAKILFHLSGQIYILATPFGIRENVNIEYYFLASMLTPAFLFKPNQVRYIFLCELLTFCAWSIKTWGHTPSLSSYWIPNNFPVYSSQILNFIGAFILTLIFLKLFIERYQKNSNMLIQARTRQEDILEGAGIGAWDWWPLESRIYFDSRWCEILGIDSRSANQTFGNWEDRIHPDDVANVFLNFKEHLDNKTEAFESIHRLRHENGSWVWILAKGKVNERDKSGKAVRFTGTHLDITKTKSAEVLMKNMQTLAKIGGWELNVQTGEMNWTSEVYEIYGFVENIQINKEMALEYYSFEARSKLTSLINNCIKYGHKFNETFEFIDYKGALKWIKTMGEPVYDSSERVTRIIGAIQDVTEQVEAEIMLEEAQKIAKIGSWSFDIKNGVIKWSKQLYNLYPENSILGPPTYERLIMTIHPEDRELWRTSVENCISNGTPYHMRFRSIFPDGKYIWQEAFGFAKKDEQGNVISLNGTSQDISNLVKAEEEAKLEKVKAMHNARLASLGEMSAGVAHEINNPLSIIVGSTWALPRVANDPEKLKNKIQHIEKATQRIAKIVNGLRKFSRSSEKSDYKIHSLPKIITEAVAMTEPKAARFEVEIIQEISTESFISCDELEVEQVIINLINNSIDAIKNLENKKITISIEEIKNMILVRISDTGPGIPIEIQRKLFQPFFTTKLIGEGTGLGLSIVKGILDEHNATIELVENISHTCFLIKFNKAIQES